MSIACLEQTTEHKTQPKINTSLHSYPVPPSRTAQALPLVCGHNFIMRSYSQQMVVEFVQPYTFEEYNDEDYQDNLDYLAATTKALPKKMRARQPSGAAASEK